VVAEKGSGDLTIGFACDEIPRFWGALIAGDEPKRGVKDFWGIRKPLWWRLLYWTREFTAMYSWLT